MNVRDEFLPAAQELLATFGAAATLTRRAASTATLAQQKRDPSLRKSGAQAVTISTTAVVAPTIVIDDAGNQLNKTIATMLDEPVLGDTLALGQTTYMVGPVTVLAPQGQAILYTAEVQ